MKAISLLAAALLLTATTLPASADTESDFERNGAVAADVLIARPLCFAATIIGAGLFIVSLPIAAAARSIDKSAGALIGVPAKQTFIRKLGDFTDY